MPSENCIFAKKNMTTEQLSALISGADLKTAVSLVSRHFEGKIVFSTSFGLEDQVITDAIFSQKIDNIEIFTLDTGRLFPETYSVWSRTCDYYDLKIKSYYPDNQTLEYFVQQNGINSFYQNTDLRKECCRIRKVEPLKRALQGAKMWITGLRAEQSLDRQNAAIFEYDAQYDLIKFNPLLFFSFEDTKKYLAENFVPYNKLHDSGFVSIGCAPCTRAIREGEDFRAGRWWWEDKEKKECGLHTKNPS
jgi:phosphoadenosine phosphosulfate reductase